VGAPRRSRRGLRPRALNGRGRGRGGPAKASAAELFVDRLRQARDRRVAAVRPPVDEEARCAFDADLFALLEVDLDLRRAAAGSQTLVELRGIDAGVRRRLLRACLVE
jgi:hypothetical protein